MTKLILGLFGLCLLELWVLIKVGAAIGAFTAIFLMLLSAAVGISLVRSQGLQTLLEAQRRMAVGQMPALEILQGMLLALAGALLIFPGFVTDLTGLLLLQPWLRHGLAKQWLRSAQVTMAGRAPGPFDDTTHNPPRSGHADTPPSAKGGTTVDGEYERKDK